MTGECALCRHVHPPTEPHIWGSQRTQPAVRNEIVAGEPGAPPPSRPKVEGDLEHWRTRALAAEAKLEAQRQRENDRKKRQRQAARKK
jgi:hypothetical protein